MAVAIESPSLVLGLAGCMFWPCKCEFTRRMLCRRKPSNTTSSSESLPDTPRDGPVVGAGARLGLGCCAAENSSTSINITSAADAAREEGITGLGRWEGRWMLR
ncbi:hypothetical protein C8Q76DRAFT_711733 [Earliella scabrosa]|nr:hypothetical protein C8Q76DRAFT_711733 [Earliella scabrosa]